MWGTEGRGERFVPNVLQQLEGSWGEAAVAIQDKRYEGAAPSLGVGAVLPNFVLLPLSHGLARGHVNVGGRVWVNPRDVKVHCLGEYVNLAVGQKDFFILFFKFN